MMVCKPYVLYLLFLCALLIAIFSFKNYGFTWDESAQRTIGWNNFDYVFKHKTHLFDTDTKDYGPAFELPVVFIENLLGQNDQRSIYLLRHFWTHLFFLFGVWSFSRLIYFLYKDTLLAIVGALFLLLMPAIYAHSFFNTKDIPFLSMFLITYYQAVKAQANPSFRRYIWLGVCTGLLVNLRVVGVLLFAVLLLFMVVEALVNLKNRQELTREFGRIAAYAAASVGTLLLTFPYLWPDPWGNFTTILKNMSHFRWEGLTLFNGEMVKTVALPWTYVPVWFGSTVPIVYLLVGVFGVGLFLLRFFQKPLSVVSEPVMRFNAIFLACFAAPPLAAILLHSVLLDSWRHMYFIYPSFILLGIFGLNMALKTRIKPVVMAVLLVGFCSTGWFMVKNAPIQHLYFNSLVNDGTPEQIRHRFELDYWGPSYKESLQYILQNDPAPAIKVAVAQFPGKFNADLLPREQAARIQVVEKREDADYFLTEYRWHPDDYPEYEGKKWHSIMVDNFSVNAIYKLK